MEGSKHTLFLDRRFVDEYRDRLDLLARLDPVEVIDLDVAETLHALLVFGNVVLEGGQIACDVHTLQLQVVLGGVVRHGAQSGGQLELRLDLGTQFLHFAPGFGVLTPHQLDDGRGERQPDEDVDHADEHVGRLLCMLG